jgi:nucleoside-diphosphate-sugar epimerase
VYTAALVWGTPRLFSDGEEMARYFSARHGVPFVGLRLSNVFDEHDYERVGSFQADPRSRSWNAWGYVDR